MAICLVIKVTLSMKKALDFVYKNLNEKAQQFIKKIKLLYQNFSH